jgi:hypothetical protein
MDRPNKEARIWRRNNQWILPNAISFCPSSGLWYLGCLFSVRAAGLRDYQGEGFLTWKKLDFLYYQVLSQLVIGGGRTLWNAAIPWYKWCHLLNFILNQAVALSCQSRDLVATTTLGKAHFETVWRGTG